MQNTFCLPIASFFSIVRLKIINNNNNDNNNDTNNDTNNDNYNYPQRIRKGLNSRKGSLCRKLGSRFFVQWFKYGRYDFLQKPRLAPEKNRRRKPAMC